MARIRSIHPAIFTDEAFMEASAHARLMVIGLWCEAWDDGVFEWKPVVLKARLFPADLVDSVALLAELASLNIVKEYTINGKRYGVIRNFQKFQRPRKPNSSGVMTPEMENFAGKNGGSHNEDAELDAIEDDEGSAPVPHQFRTSAEKRNQMEDGGWRMEDGVVCDEGADAISSKPNLARKPLPDDWPDVPALKVLVETINSPWLDPSKSGGLQMPGEIGQWRMNRCSWTEDVVPVVAAMVSKAKKSIGSWSYFTRAIYENRDTRLKAGPAPPTVQAPRRSDEERQAIGVLEDFRRWDGDGFPWPKGDFPDRLTILQIIKTHGDADDLARFHLEFGEKTQAKKQLETGELVAEL